MIDLLNSLTKLVVTFAVVSIGVSLLIVSIKHPKTTLKFIWKTLREMKKAYDDYQSRKPKNI